MRSCRGAGRAQGIRPGWAGDMRRYSERRPLCGLIRLIAGRQSEKLVVAGHAQRARLGWARDVRRYIERGPLCAEWKAAGKTGACMEVQCSTLQAVRKAVLFGGGRAWPKSNARMGRRRGVKSCRRQKGLQRGWWVIGGARVRGSALVPLAAQGGGCSREEKERAVGGCIGAAMQKKERGPRHWAAAPRGPELQWRLKCCWVH
eukprot:5004614-Pleurochrysis_carterae.AAC.1